MTLYQTREAHRRQRRLYLQRAYYHLAQAGVSRCHLDHHTAVHHASLAAKFRRRIKATNDVIQLLTDIID